MVLKVGGGCLKVGWLAEGRLVVVCRWVGGSGGGVGSWDLKDMVLH